MLSVGLLRRAGVRLSRTAVTPLAHRSGVLSHLSPLSASASASANEQPRAWYRRVYNRPRATEKHTVVDAKASASAATKGQPKLLSGGGKATASEAEHNAALSELRAFTRANQQTLPIVPNRPPPKPLVRLTDRKAKNKAESKVLAHFRRMRLIRTRELFPAPPRPYFPPLRVNHTPKPLHVRAAAEDAAARNRTPTTVLSERLANFIQRTALTAVAPGTALPDSKQQLALPPSASASASAVVATGGAADTRFAVVDINSKQHKVVAGDLLMVDRLKDVGVGDRLSFDRILMVAGKHYTVIGRPFIPYARVTMTCEELTHTRHMIIFKKHRRKGYRKTKGFRARVTLLRVDDIQYDADADTTAEVLPAAASAALGPNDSFAPAPTRVKPARAPKGKAQATASA